MNLPLILIPTLAVMVALSISISNTYGLTNVNTTTVNTTSFSIDVPDNWAYESPLSVKVNLAPSEFAGIMADTTTPLDEQMKEGGAFSSFQPDFEYMIKNAPFDVYVKYVINKQGGMQATSKQNATVGGQPAVKVYGDGVNSFSGIKFVEYMLMHNKEPYYLGYMANVKDYEKYLPEFEQIVKTFTFIK